MEKIKKKKKFKKLIHIYTYIKFHTGGSALGCWGHFTASCFLVSPAGGAREREAARLRREADFCRSGGQHLRCVLCCCLCSSSSKEEVRGGAGRQRRWIQVAVSQDLQN